MYTGIVQDKREVNLVVKNGEVTNFGILFSDQLVENLKIGASVSIAGVCLTVTRIEGEEVFFDAMKETLDKTTLGHVKEGDFVNVERSAKYGDEIGGHEMAGHIIGKAKIIAREDHDESAKFTFEIPVEFMDYIFEKGFIGINGCSLTVTDPDRKKGEFSVWMIPETLKITTFGELKKGDEVNIELDHRTKTMVDTIERIMKEKYAR